MFPNDFQAVAVILLSIVPGFLATTFWARTKTWKGRSTDLQTVIQSIAVSAVIQVVMAPLTLLWLYPERSRLDHDPVRVAVWLALVVLVVPVAGGILAARLSDTLFNPASSWVSGRLSTFFARFVVPPAPPPSMWDWLFAGNVPEQSFLVVEFSDGRRVAGVFAKGAAALTSPQSQGVFLTREWSLDDHGDLVAEVPNTAGVMITSSESVRIVRILTRKDVSDGTEQGQGPGVSQEP